MAFCPKCGLAVDLKVTFCGNCGGTIATSKLSDEKLYYNSGESTKKGNVFTIFFIVLSSCLILPIIVFGLRFIVTVSDLSKPKLAFNERSALGFLFLLRSEQESWREKSTSHTYGKLKEVLANSSIVLPNETLGYTFYDLTSEPNAEFYAVVASPIVWGKSGAHHYIVTNTGVVRSTQNNPLPFKIAVEGDQKLIDTIEMLKEAR